MFRISVCETSTLACELDKLTYGDDMWHCGMVLLKVEVEGMNQVILIHVGIKIKNLHLIIGEVC